MIKVRGILRGTNLVSPWSSIERYLCKASKQPRAVYIYALDDVLTPGTLRSVKTTVAYFSEGEQSRLNMRGKQWCV